MLNSIVVALWSLLFVEILLVRFRKIPFTCSYPPFRDSAVVVALSYVLGFVIFVVLTSYLEHWGLSNPAWMGFLIATVLVSWVVVFRMHREVQAIDKELIFEDSTPASFDLLDLGRGT